MDVEKDRKLRNLKLSYYPYHLMMTMINIMMQHLSITFTLTTPLESKGGAWSSRLFHIASCSTTFSYESIIPSPALPTGSLSAKLTSRHVSSSSSQRTTVLPGAGLIVIHWSSPALAWSALYWAGFVSPNWYEEESVDWKGTRVLFRWCRVPDELV